jgi:hypothetical protein
MCLILYFYQIFLILPLCRNRVMYDQQVPDSEITPFEDVVVDL